ncbi:hypothetical protein ACOME3_000980 [Neoechinorhynchus agilis]
MDEEPAITILRSVATTGLGGIVYRFSYSVPLDVVWLQLNITDYLEALAIDRFTWEEGGGEHNHIFNVVRGRSARQVEVGIVHYTSVLPKYWLILHLLNHQLSIIQMGFCVPNRDDHHGERYLCCWQHNAQVTCVNYRTVDTWCTLSRYIGDPATSSRCELKEYYDRVSLGVYYLQTMG